MFSVIKLGGVNGSGKTTVARGLIEVTKAQPAQWKGNKKAPNFYRGEYRKAEVLILGSYETTCGGMDTISDKIERLEFVRWACKPGRIVFFEGLITGKTYGALGELSETHVKRGRGLWTYAFMDTPYDVSVARVLARRQAAGNSNPFDPDRTMEPTHRSCVHLSEKLRGLRQAKIGPQPMSHPVLMLDHTKTGKELADQLLKYARSLL